MFEKKKVIMPEKPHEILEKRPILGHLSSYGVDDASSTTLKNIITQNPSLYSLEKSTLSLYKLHA